MEYEIKITGSGNRHDIARSLRRIIRTIEGCSSEELDDFSDEDPTLYTEIKTLENEETEQ
jgi:hypothetical protein